MTRQLALDREEAGNRVARVTLAEIAAAIRTDGFEVVRAQRYAMYYAHTPGRLFALASKPGLFQAVTGGWRVANALVGRYGNKCVVVGVRRPTSP